MRNNLNEMQRCPGCGGFMSLASIKLAIKELGIPKQNLLVVGGIGCSGKTPQYVDGYGVEALHGRTIPFAIGAKLSNPDLTVIAIGGDGDGYGIGLSHFIHACRKNIDITYIVLDNENYALTTGQASPTTPLNKVTRSTPKGNKLNPLDPILLAKASGCEFSEQMENYTPKDLKEKIKEAIQFPGFSHINIKQKCIAWNK